ncbi:unnamed protein product [Cunninghamella blakesleeana]
MIPSLPFEIIELINHQLTNTDKYQCLMTCHSWYNAFKYMLYQQCKINNRKSFTNYYHTLEKDKLLCDQVKTLDVSQCDISEQEHQYILLVCSNLKDYSFRWDSSAFLHDSTFLENKMNQQKEQKKQLFPPILPNFQKKPMCHQPNLPVWPVNTILSETEPFRSSKYAYLSTLRLHDATVIGLLNIIKQLPFLKQLDLISLKLDIHIQEIEWIHAYCPQLASLSFDIHTLSSLPSCSSSSFIATDSMDWLPSYSMKHLKLVYKHLDKPGKTPWISYIQQKYPTLTTLEMQTKYTRRKNYWQWNGNNLDDGQQQQSMLDHMDDHPDFRLALKNWAQSCFSLSSISFSGIPWDQWFFQHLPKLNDHHHPSSSPSSISTIKKIHVIRMNDNIDTASTIFWTLMNHPSILSLTHLNIRPVAIKPNIHFYEALSKLKSLKSLTIQQQGICSNKQLSCQLDIQSILYYCPSLKILNLGGLELTQWDDQKRIHTHSYQQQEKQQQHLQLEQLSLSTTRVNHHTLQQMIQCCPQLNKFSFISCEYDAFMEHNIPTLEIGHPKQKWKEVHINYPSIHSSTNENNFQPIGLSGRRQCESPRFLTTMIHHHAEKKEENEKWFQLLPITNYYYFNRHQSNLTQHSIPFHQIDSIIYPNDQENSSLRKDALDYGRIKMIGSSISNLFINGTRIIL